MTDMCELQRRAVDREFYWGLRNGQRVFDVPDDLSSLDVDENPEEPS